jgi:electron transport complex protein RnfB
MLSAVFGLSLLALLLALLLVWVARRFPADSDPLVVEIESLLPQTQCAQCGYPGCRPYAEAIASGESEINRCPPGGAATIQALADLLGCEPRPLDESLGEEKPPLVAVIDEAVCIGCKLCIQACPVDAILGSAKRMHTVIADECTGCELCLPPCPVDCIELIPAPHIQALPEVLSQAQVAQTRAAHTQNAQAKRIDLQVQP